MPAANAFHQLKALIRQHGEWDGQAAYTWRMFSYTLEARGWLCRIEAPGLNCYWADGHAIRFDKGNEALLITYFERAGNGF